MPGIDNPNIFTDPYNILAQRALANAMGQGEAPQQAPEEGQPAPVGVPVPRFKPPVPQGAPAEAAAPANDLDGMVRNMMQRQLDRANKPYVDPGESPAVRKAREIIDRLSNEKPEDAPLNDRQKGESLMHLGFGMMANRSPFPGFGDGGKNMLEYIQRERARAAEASARRGQLQLTGVNMELHDEARREAANARHEDKQDAAFHSAGLLGIKAAELKQEAERYKEEMKLKNKHISLTEAANQLAVRKLESENKLPLLDKEGTIAGSFNKETGEFSVRNADGKIVTGDEGAQLAKEMKLSPPTAYGSNVRAQTEIEKANLKAKTEMAKAKEGKGDWISKEVTKRWNTEANMNPALRKMSKEDRDQWEIDAYNRILTSGPGGGEATSTPAPELKAPAATRPAGGRPADRPRPTSLNVNGANMPYVKALEQAQAGYNAPNADKKAIMDMWTKMGGNPADLK